MQIQKSVIFVKKILEMNMWKVKNIVVRDNYHFTGKY